ncbi:hypothetical protein ACF3M2_12710 [Tissierella carlieri]|uniref:Uncharacterized protein n=1 Tax=Tissierella carlieri TaxID=689904 RepID=A0ABT1S6J0_9FIRM|nr:hypothetical protein [Tissierella carlieri]MCQ4922084.1 hypothetical protein [Tissierella carlieri]
MKKLTTKIISFILTLSMILGIGTTTFANGVELNIIQRDAKHSDVIVTDEGIYINGSYYTQEQFIQLLDTAIEIENPTGGINTQSAAALVAGTWWIPGIGEVVITAAGVIIVGGAVIKAGTWIYNAVVEWFEARAEAKDYEKAKKDGKPTKNHSRTKSHKQKDKGEPYSSNDNYDEKGKLKERRYFGKDGKPDMDIHYTDHGNPKLHPKVPHRHDWKNGKPGPGY